MPKVQLTDLEVTGLGPIDQVRLELEGGLIAITGETGAGKTLLVDALTLALGLGETRALRNSNTVVSLVLDVNGREVNVRREVSEAGRLRSILNGKLSSVDEIRSFFQELIVLHGQHDSLSLVTRSAVLEWLDRFGRIDTFELDLTRRELADVRAAVADLGGSESERARERDLLTYQISEIAAADIVRADELDVVLEELTDLTSRRDSAVTSMGVAAALDGDGDRSLLDEVAQVLKTLEERGSVGEVRRQLVQHLDALRGSVHDLRDLASFDDDDGQRLERLEQRASQLRDLLRKYGGSLEAVIAFRQEVEARLIALSDGESELARLTTEIARLEGSLATLEEKALADRRAAADSLSEAVTAQLDRVALPNALVSVDVLGPDGSDVEILFTPNPGRPGGPLKEVGSGGELSRLLLALSLVSLEPEVVVVFDEVDAGVGGEAAQKLAEALADLARAHQVIVVTHMATIAAAAAQHFVVEKVLRGGIAETRVREVAGEQRVKEVGRMLTGRADDEETRRVARRLIEQGIKHRES